MMMNGTVGVLSVGAGDTKFSFDPTNPIERIRAARIVKDMLRRGYVLLVETDVGGEKKFTRALDFDEEKCEYIIADFDPTVEQSWPPPPPPELATFGQPSAQPEHEENHAQEEDEPGGAAPAGKKPGRKPGTKRVKAEATRSVAVARTAGG